MNNEINVFNTSESDLVSSKKKSKKFWFIILIIVIISVIVFVITNLFFSIKWDAEFDDFSLEVVTQSEISLGVISSDENFDDFSISTDCGDAYNEDNEIYWNLKNATGECTIKVNYKMTSIKKTYNVVPFDIEKDELFLTDFDENLNLGDDPDYDKLTNDEEEQHNTNPNMVDTDMDNLDDYYEIYTSKTDPNKKDSKDDGIIDGKRTNEYLITDDNFEMNISGTGNIASTYVNIESNTKISDKDGLVNLLYTFYTEAELETVTITITYDDEIINELGYNENKLSIYYYDEKTLEYKKVDTVVDIDNKTITAVLTHFSSYVVGDSSLFNEDIKSEVLFVLDNSWSMYSHEQYTELTGEEYTIDSLSASDTEGLRFSLSKSLISDLIKKGFDVGLSEFRRDYANILSIGSSKESLDSKLNDMYGKFATKTAGTDIYVALNGSISAFESDNTNNTIIILTDGEDDLTSREVTNIIENANDKNISICSIGFSAGVSNVDLSNISNSTGCKLFSSSDSSGIKELFDNLGVQLNDDLIDIDEDEDADGRLIADSGFIVSRDGFSFPNYGTTQQNGGHCYGMATFAELFYSKVLPLKNEVIDDSHEYNLKYTYFDDYENLFDYKLQTNELKYTFGFEYFGEESPSDILVKDDYKLVYEKKYRNEIVDSNMYRIDDLESKLDKDARIEKYGFNYNTYENAILDVEKIQDSDVIYKEDLNLLNAIYYAFIRQNYITHYSSSSNLILWLRGLIGTEDYINMGGNTFVNLITSRLNNSEAPVISSSFSNGLHAVNAIKLIQDVDNPNYYYIGVYDNNYPGEVRYVDMECNKNSCVTKANEYYTSSNQPIRITPSLEYDLLYYNYE